MSKYRVVELPDGFYRVQEFMFGLFWKSKTRTYGWHGEAHYDYQSADQAISAMNDRINEDKLRAFKKMQPRYTVIAEGES
jgi:hypothetical protein